MATTTSNSGSGGRVNNTKLRSTCNPCAAAKVGCGKEKPICTRCMSRGLDCHYSATKRAGRISHSMRQAADASRQHATQHSSDRAVDSIENAWPSQSSSNTHNPSASDQSSLSSAFPSRGTNLFATDLSPSEGSHTLLPNVPSPSFDELIASAPYFQAERVPEHNTSGPSPLEDNNDFNGTNSYGDSSSNSSTYFNGLHDSGFDNLGGYSFGNMQAFMRPTVGFSNDNNGISQPNEDYGQNLGLSNRSMSHLNETINFGQLERRNLDTSSFENRHRNNSWTSVAPSIANAFSNSDTDTGMNSDRSSVNLFPGVSGGTPSTSSTSSTLPLSRSLRAPTPHSSPDSQFRTVPFCSSQGSNQDSSRRCLTRALALLPQFPLNASELYSQASIGDSPAVTVHSPGFVRTMGRNEQAGEIIRATLQCPCSKDGYLLVILSLAIFRILASYKAVSHGTPIDHQSLNESNSSGSQQCNELLQHKSTTASDTEGQDEDTQPRAGQLVLSKLPFVQHLVSTLSERLRELGDRVHRNEARSGASTREDDHSEGAHSLDTEMLLRPFSAQLALTLEADMRKSVSQLSRTIIDRLRQE